MNSKQVKDHKIINVYLQKALIVGCLATAFIVFGYSIYLEDYLSRHSPRGEKPETGQVIETSVNHGTRIYITQQEKFETIVLLPLGFAALFFAGVLLNGKWKHFSSFKDS